jgi:hypothetical protein
MAVWTQIYGTDLWSAAVTKINNVIGSYNNWSGGTENQRKVKSSVTDFDTAWCDPEGKINSASSFNLNTLLVGDTKTIALPYHSYSTEGNIAIKAFSSASGLNYILGNITATPDNQNITVEIYEIGGSGTHTDMVIVPFGLDYNQESLYLAGAYPNGIFITAPALTGATFDYHNLSWVRNGNMATVSGEFHFIATGIIINDTIDMVFQTDRWIKNGVSLDIMGTASVIRINGSNYTSHPALCSNYSVVNGLTITVLPLTTVVADNVILQFSFSYIIA